MFIRWVVALVLCLTLPIAAQVETRGGLENVTITMNSAVDTIKSTFMPVQSLPATRHLHFLLPGHIHTGKVQCRVARASEDLKRRPLLSASYSYEKNTLRVACYTGSNIPRGEAAVVEIVGVDVPADAAGAFPTAVPCENGYCGRDTQCGDLGVEVRSGNRASSVLYASASTIMTCTHIQKADSQ